MKKDKPQMLTRLINTLRRRGAQGRSFPVQASEATQAAELIAEVVAQRDALFIALSGFSEVIGACEPDGKDRLDYVVPIDVVDEFEDKAFAVLLAAAKDIRSAT